MDISHDKLCDWKVRLWLLYPQGKNPDASRVVQCTTEVKVYGSSVAVAVERAVSLFVCDVQVISVIMC